MKILHISAHLGGGVGKAFSALARLDGAEIERHFVLLEAPRDTRHADAIRQSGAVITVAPDAARLRQLVAAADVVQIEWWNHPRLYECLCRSDLSPARTIIWAHISGLFAPLIPPALLSAPHQFLFTSRCSLESKAVQALPPAERDRLGVANSGFGFEETSDAPMDDSQRASAVAYLGTVHFSKLSPLFFDVVDRAAPDRPVSVWGDVEQDGNVMRHASTMRDPRRIRFEGHASDPAAILRHVGIFLYLLQPHHFGTAENALIEAMSLGCVPIVLDNPAERAIVEHGVTGFIENSAEAVAQRLNWMLGQPETVRSMGHAAMEAMAATRSVGATWEALTATYRHLLTMPKRPIDYAAILGDTPADWFLSTQEQPFSLVGDDGAPRKGTLSHFTSCFPDDASLTRLAADC